MTVLIEQITYLDEICKLNLCTRTLDTIGSYLMFSARTLFNGRSVCCYQQKNEDTGQMTLQFQCAKFPKKNFWRVTLAIILFFPLTPLGLLVKGAALICSKNLRDCYFEFHEFCKRPTPKGPTNVSHIQKWPPSIELYKDYQDHLFYPLEQGRTDRIKLDYNISWARIFSPKIINIELRGEPRIVLHYNEETACLGHIKAFFYAHGVPILGGLRGFENGKGLIIRDNDKKIKDVLANGESSLTISTTSE